MSDKEWRYKEGDKFSEPCSEEHILSLIKGGVLSQRAMVRSRGDSEWQSVQDAFSLEGAAPSLLSSGKSVSSEAIWKEGPPCLWRRYFARTLEMNFLGYGTLLLLFLVFGIADVWFLDGLLEVLGGKFGNGVSSVSMALLTVVINVIVIGMTGTSFGKWVFGIKILDAQSNPLGYKLALKRELIVLFKGVGLAIPFLIFAMLGFGYLKLKKDGITSWDKELGLKVYYRENTRVQTVISIVVYLGLVGGMTAYVFL